MTQLLLNALIAGSVYALVSVSLALTYKLFKYLNFAHGQSMMIGAYLFYFFTVQLGWGAIFSIFPTIFLIFLLAYLFLRLFVKPFLNYGSSITFIASIALAVLIESIISIFFGSNIKSLILTNNVINLSNALITPIQILTIISTFVILGLLIYFIYKSSLGRKISALSENSLAAQGLGINSRSINYLVSVIAMAITGYAGILVSYDVNMSPTMGSSFLIKAFAIMLISGFGNIWAVVISSYLLAIIENYAVGLNLISMGYLDAFTFVIILFVLLVRPQGIFYKKERLI
ncbi:MAG: branched-chain amino acid ABC transporter permease [Candidatus Falkowbacteria bacterium]